ncbi:MAG: hypothetical protein KC505_02530 [Myxococcales bacterium]|nr:hypothetical protein [Myxococcales bacterium]USN50377.1 MAG: hypothetical protein H6731_08950 [Myxococcales bacterium]
METQKHSTFNDGTEVFFILKNQNVVNNQKTLPNDFYVKGIMENGRFKATSQVLGLGELATQGRYGWIELNSKEFFPMESDQKANTPFVKGYMTDSGFYPSEREVIDAP